MREGFNQNQSKKKKKLITGVRKSRESDQRIIIDRLPSDVKDELEDSRLPSVSRAFGLSA